MRLHTLDYRADSRDRARRVVLVIKEREGDLLLDRFFLVTFLAPEQMSRQEVLDHYRERGTAEGHMGELKDVLAPAFAIVARTNGATWLIVHQPAEVALPGAQATKRLGGRRRPCL